MGPSKVMPRADSRSALLGGSSAKRNVGAIFEVNEVQESEVLPELLFLFAHCFEDFREAFSQKRLSSDHFDLPRAHTPPMHHGVFPVAGDGLHELCAGEIGFCQEHLPRKSFREFRDFIQAGEGGFVAVGCDPQEV